MLDYLKRCNPTNNPTNQFFFAYLSYLHLLLTPETITPSQWIDLLKLFDIPGQFEEGSQNAEIQKYARLIRIRMIWWMCSQATWADYIE